MKLNPSYTRRADSIILVLTILAAMPYEEGPIATIIPPSWKPWVATVGLIAKMIIAEVKSKQTSHNV